MLQTVSDFPETINYRGNMFIFQTKQMGFGIYLHGKEVVVASGSGRTEEYYFNIDQHPVLKLWLK